MARPLRFEYPEAVYHIMARGDGGKSLFIDEEDHLLFLHWLSRVCKSHGWQVHAWVIMRNHFHLLLETPEPNLVSGMRLLLGSFAQAWNRRYKRRGHVFQGRYKSIPVSGESASDAYQFQVVADYIHLNPARAGIARFDDELKTSIFDYPWSSLVAYQSGKKPKWLVFDRVLSAFELAENRRGRRAYVEYLEKRSADEQGELSDEAMLALKKGWYLGDDTFRDRLLSMVEDSSRQLKSKGSHDSKILKRHGEYEAEKFLVEGIKELGLKDEVGEWVSLRKGDLRKVALASVIKVHMNVTNLWLSEKLEMGHDRSVSRLIRQGRENSEVIKMMKELEVMLPCED